MKIPALPLFLTGLLALPATAADGPTTVPPPGDYKVAFLVLEKGGLTITPTWGVGVAQHNGDLHLRGAFRDGKLKVPGRLSVRQIVSELTVEGDAIRGTYVYQGPRTGYEQRYAVEATVRGGRVAGTWKDGQGKTGRVSGVVRTEAELAKENAFTTKADWPFWSGPFTSFAATPCGLALVEDFNKDARLVWRSEELMPNGNGNALNYDRFALNDRTMGGGASLVVAGGKVFAHYYQPAGDEYMPERLKQLQAEAAKAKVTELSPYTMEKYAVRADDVLVCMDAATGKTLWKAVFPGALNQPSHKGGVVNNTPCVGGGRVFALDSAGNLRGLDAASGKLLWQVPGMSAESVKPWSGARNMCTAPVYAGGTLIVPDHGTTLYGLDPATGKRLWKLPGKSHPFQVPARWSHQGREYVISMTAGKRDKESGNVASAACVDPATGKILWEVELPPNPNKGVSVFGDVMYVTAAGVYPPGFKGFPQRNDVSFTNAAGTCTAYRLTPGKAEKLWQSAATHAAGDAPPAVNGKYVVVGGPKETHLYDAATGKDLATYAGPGPFNEGYAAFVEDRVVLSLDGSHGHSDMVVLGAKPETFKKLCHWVQPHPQTTSYHNKFMTFPMVEGRIFLRGYDGVYCYDLRAGGKK